MRMEWKGARNTAGGGGAQAESAYAHHHQVARRCDQVYSFHSLPAVRLSRIALKMMNYVILVSRQGEPSMAVIPS